MLFWENQFPELGAVHHLLVLCYYLQHPSLYSPEGLAYGLQLLVEFLTAGLTPDSALRRNRPQVRSDRRSWKIAASPGSHGAYPNPVDWTTRAADVTAAGPQSYLDSIPTWAGSLLTDLRATGNLPVRDLEDKPER
jgi:hypothetical protein